VSSLLQYRIHARTRAYAVAVERASERLAEAASLGRVLVSSSWGKDSVVLVYLAARAGLTEVLHMPSPAAMPGTDEIEAWCAEHMRVSVFRTPMATIEERLAWTHEVGLGHERTASQQAAVVQSLKKSKGTAYAIERGFGVMALGLRGAESGARAMNARARGAIYPHSDGVTRCLPLLDWSARDVWACIAVNGLPYLPLYDLETHGQTRETIRNAGWTTTDGAARSGRVAWLKHHFPEYFARMKREFPQIAEHA